MHANESCRSNPYVFESFSCSHNIFKRERTAIHIDHVVYAIKIERKAEWGFNGQSRVFPSIQVLEMVLSGKYTTNASSSSRLRSWFDSSLRDGEPMLQHNGTDLIDRKILQELSLDARLPVAELGRRIKLSPSATAERVRRLESLELIRGYRADINLQALGFSITAFVRLTCDGNRYRPFLKFIPTLDAVQECHHLTGGDAFLLKVVLSSVAQLEDLIEKLLPYGSPTTSMVLSTPLES